MFCQPGQLFVVNLGAQQYYFEVAGRGTTDGRDVRNFKIQKIIITNLKRRILQCTAIASDMKIKKQFTVL